MTLFTSLLTNPTALTIADLVAKAALIVGVAAAVTHLLKWRRASAATQHLVWAASIVALVALPVLTLTVPAWIVEVAQAPSAPPIPADAGTSIDSPEPFVSTVGETAQNAAQTPIAPVPQSAATALPSLTLMQFLAGLYLIGLAGLLLRLALGSWSVARLARNTAPVVDPGWLALLRDLSWTLGIDRPVRLLQSDDATIPMTWGTRRPHILLPTEANDWPVERRRAVLTHELAHVVRFDCLTQWLASLVCAFYWVHPAAWYAARRLRVERERACDDYVIQHGMQPREYANELFEVAQKYRGSGITAAAALGMARPSELEGRMLSLMDGVRSHHAASRNWVAAVVLGMAAILVPLGCVQPGIAQANGNLASVYDASDASDMSDMSDVSDAKDADDASDASDANDAEDANDADDAYDANDANDAYDAYDGRTQDPRQTISRSVPARDGGTLVLDLRTGGNIIIRPHDRNTVDLRAQLGGRDWRRTEVTMTPAGSTVRIESRLTPEEGNWSTSHSFQISVPRRQNIRIRSAGGKIDLRDVEGTFTGNTGGGEIILSQLRGTATLTTGGGAITVTDSRLEGAVSTGGGAVQFRNVSGGIRGNGNTGNFGSERGGTVESTGSGVLVSHTAGGDIDIPSAPGGADVRTGGGTIRVGPARGFVHARTGGGAITIESIDGRAHATTGAGAVSIRMVGDPRRGNRDIEVHAGVGAVTLWLPDGIEAEFDIETAYTNNFRRRVRIESDFPLSYSESPDWEARQGTPRKYVRAMGRTGAGTHKIRVRTANGDVTIRRGSRRTSAAPGASSFVSSGPDGSGSDCVGDDCTVTTRNAEPDGFAFVTGEGESRRAAVRAMARNAPEAAAIAGLERIAFEDSDAQVQLEATRELAKFTNITAIRALRRITLEHPSAAVRTLASQSIAKLGRVSGEM